VRFVGPLLLGVASALATPWAPAIAGGAARVAFDARATYLRDCASCHGVAGEGTPRAPRIDDKGASDVDYELSTGRMPIAVPTQQVRRRPPRYPPDQIRALVDYTSGLGEATGPPVPDVDLRTASLQRGGELFRLQCAACHAWAGDGGALLLREAPGLHQATPTQIAEAVRAGPGTMPVFPEAALTHDDLASVVAYVRYLRHPADRGGNGLWHLGPLVEGAVAVVIGLGIVVLVLQWIGEREPAP